MPPGLRLAEISPNILVTLTQQLREAPESFLLVFQRLKIPRFQRFSTHGGPRSLLRRQNVDHEAANGCYDLFFTGFVFVMFLLITFILLFRCRNCVRP